MATINYNGMELEEFAPENSCFFDPPKKAVFINEDHVPIREKRLFSFDKRFKCPFTDEENLCWPHCALFPDPPKPRRATNRELARWLAQGNGEHKEIITDHECCMTYFYYSDRGRNVELPKGIKVRKWSDTEWHEPTVDYLFGGV